MKKFKLVIFDLDGTLVNAYAAIAGSFNFTMRKIGRPLQRPAVIRAAVGWGDRNLLRPFVKPQNLDRALAIYRRHHAASLVRYSRLYAGAKRLLTWLKKNGYKLAVASNRPTRFSRILMRHLGIAGYFDYCLCADKLDKGKPHPLMLRRIMQRLAVLPEETLYVGDMVIDARAGRRARVKTAIVTTGSSSRTEIARLKPWRIIGSLNGLRGLLSPSQQ
ncbi:MAG: HAD family hydrolase [Candidatus Omnitrophica bacterium]|nr:HAD family hydrolase [Candidatus Omnitrophota bacterium]